MASPGLGSTIILSEIILLETTLIIGVGIYLFLKTKKKSKKLSEALKSFSDNENERLNALTNTLQKPGHLDDKKYNETIKNIILNENNIFNSMANIIYHKDLDLIDSFGKELTSITKPCENLLSHEQQPSKETASEEKEPIIDVDDAIDDLLSDETDKNTEEGSGNDPEKDPAFDLSEAADNEIAEIPSELLEAGITDTTDELEISQDEGPNSDDSPAKN